MIDWLFERVLLPFVAFVGVCLILLVAFLIGFFVWAISTDYKTPAAKAYEQCLDDGQKEYACYAMIYGGRAK